jgi:hypothetical protein
MKKCENNKFEKNKKNKKLKKIDILFSFNFNKQVI